MSALLAQLAGTVVSLPVMVPSARSLLNWLPLWRSLWLKNSENGYEKS